MPRGRRHRKIENPRWIKPESDFIDALGGPERVANLLIAHRSVHSISHQAVSHWRRRGVPYRHRPLLSSIALGLGISVPEGFLSPTVDQRPGRPPPQHGVSP
jgi:hypothetical protein